MISDITFGQFVPTGSVVHKADPRVKLLLLIAYIVFIFVCGNFYSLGVCALFLISVILITKIPIKMYLKNIKVILPIIIFTAILNALYVSTGEVIFSWWIITLSTDGIIRALFMAFRIVLLVLSSAVLSYTTSPNSLTSAIESLLSPLKFIGLQGAVHTLAMTMTIALRFIPTLIEETQKIINAQKARGADIESGNLFQRVKAMLPILIPLIISSIRRAYELAEAMECRCYNGYEGRTKYKVLKLSLIDLINVILFVVLLSAIIVLNIYF